MTSASVTEHTGKQERFPFRAAGLGLTAAILGMAYGDGVDFPLLHALLRAN